MRDQSLTGLRIMKEKKYMKTVWGRAPVIMKTTHTDKKMRDNFKINVKFYQLKKIHESPKSHHKHTKCMHFVFHNNMLNFCKKIIPLYYPSMSKSISEKKK